MLCYAEVLCIRDGLILLSIGENLNFLEIILVARVIVRKKMAGVTLDAKGRLFHEVEEYSFTFMPPLQSHENDDCW